MSVYANTPGAAAPPRANIAARLGAIVLIVLGLLSLVTSLLGFLPEEPRMTVMGLMLFAILGLILGGAGVVWLRKQTTSEVGERNVFQERAVLDLMARKGGEATLADVSRQLSVGHVDAEAIFGRLTAQRLVEPDLTNEGTVVYRLRE